MTDTNLSIAKNQVVSIHYTLTDSQNEVIDTSEGNEPLVYLHGAGGIIPGLEFELEGKKIGEKFKVTIPPEKAYGPRAEGLVQEVPKVQFPNPDQLEVGMSFQTDTDQGPMVFTITEVQGLSVTVDGNHPLAGEALTFDVTVQDIRTATDEELQHGHVHGPGGHHHG